MGSQIEVTRRVNADACLAFRGCVETSQGGGGEKTEFLVE